MIGDSDNSPKPYSPTVLVAEDDEASREYLSELLRKNGMKVEVVENGQNVVNRVHSRNLDLVLLDISTPNMNGLDTCRLIKSVTENDFLPVILLTAKTDIDSRVIGIRIGADDYICKPFDERELLARVNNLLRIKKKHNEIIQSKEHLQSLVIRDDLTGLFNYRYLQTRLNEEFIRAERYHEPLACIMTDIDFFRRINNLFGHEAGDKLLREVADRLNSAVREIDVVVRYGGEEFLFILPSTNFTGALSAADRIWRTIGSEPFLISDTSQHITISLGVAVFPSSDIKSKDDLIKAADRALYQSKKEGRDGICVFQHQGYIYQPEIEDVSLKE